MNGDTGIELPQPSRVEQLVSLFINSQRNIIYPSQFNSLVETVSRDPLGQEEATQLIDLILASYDSGVAGQLYEWRTTSDPKPIFNSPQEFRMFITTFITAGDWTEVQLWRNPPSDIYEGNAEAIELPYYLVALAMLNRTKSSIASDRKAIERFKTDKDVYGLAFQNSMQARTRSIAIEEKKAAVLQSAVNALSPQQILE